MGISVCSLRVRKENGAYATFGLRESVKENLNRRFRPSGSDRSGTGSDLSGGLSDADGRRGGLFGKSGAWLSKITLV